MAVEITEDTVRKAEKCSKKARKDETSEEKEKEHKKRKAGRQARAEEGELEREDRKDKKKKRKLDEDQWAAEEDGERKKRKKKRSKHEDDVAEVSLNNSEGARETVDVSIEASPKHRKHKRKDSGAHTDLPGESSQDVEEETVKSEKKSKSKHKSTGDGEVMSVEKKKKKKHKISGSAAEESERSKSKKRKHSKKDTGYPDPTEDSTLNEQASKALSYARSQFSSPDSWKFNKARQNWLTRNVWSAESIPDTYMPLVTRYLSKVQGGVRENLLKVCNATLSASAPSVSTAESMEKSPLKSILKSSGASKGEETATNPVEQPAQPSILPYQTRRFRAEALLQALSSQATNAADMA